ncbi:MAG: GntR family transcriptional regulator [Rhodospirillales bacterium]|nr:GntR family transcriptional regulator [Rhodospirillales bacterium]
MSTAAPTFSPLYRQIKGLIMQSLESAEWRPGEVIPSEIELALRYKVSQGTVRKAIDELAAENYLSRRQGKGTFVATHDEARAQFRFLRLMPDVGAQAYPVSRLLECKRARASAEIARLLELKAGDAVVCIRRVLSFGDEPTVFEHIYLPGALFRKLSAAIFNEYKGSMYKLFETEFGTRMIRAEEKIRAVAADAVTAELLGVPGDAPLLCVERVAFSYGDKPVEFRRGYYRTDKHYYSNELG